MTSVRLQATLIQVRIRNFIHKGLKKLYVDDATKGVPPDTVDKLRKMFAFLDEMEGPEEFADAALVEGAYLDGRP